MAAVSCRAARCEPPWLFPAWAPGAPRHPRRSRPSRPAPRVVEQLRAKVEADQEVQQLLGMSGAWGRFVLQQLDEGGDGKVNLQEFRAGLGGMAGPGKTEVRV